jgi:NAD(P)-dependent dehydrogenase (short-subunit alcohol dehydrogenase family)
MTLLHYIMGRKIKIANKKRLSMMFRNGAKAAVEGLTRSLAAEFAPRIRVNAIAPSLTDTPLAKVLLSSEEKRKASAERHPAKRIGKPQEIAQVAVHLLSESSDCMTGQIIHVDGGMSALRTFR